jgi:hypothetical protein
VNIVQVVREADLLDAIFPAHADFGRSPGSRLDRKSAPWISFTITVIEFSTRILWRASNYPILTGRA